MNLWGISVAIFLIYMNLWGNILYLIELISVLIFLIFTNLWGNIPDNVNLCCNLPDMYMNICGNKPDNIHLSCNLPDFHESLGQHT